MRGVLVVLVFVLAGHASDAAAQDCQVVHRVYPADGSTGVPTNARVWIFGENNSTAYQLDGQPLGSSYWSVGIMKLDLGMLAPRHTYAVTTHRGEHVTTFTTGDDADSTKPRPPMIKQVGSDHGRITVSAESPGLGVWVRTWRHTDVEVPWAGEFLPAEGFDAAFATCNQPYRTKGSDCVELRSVDLEGRSSGPVSNCPLPADPAWMRKKVPRETPRPYTRNNSWLLIVLGVIAGLAVLLRRRIAELISAIRS